MENSKKLELTLCGMLPYGLKIDASYYDEEIPQKIIGIHPNRGVICSDKQYGKYGLTESDYAVEHIKPLLHSIDKLIEPILEGGLIPIVELAKITHIKENHKIEMMQSCYGENNGFKYTFTFCDGSFTMRCFIKNEWVDHAVYNQTQLFEKLKEWHFNIYNLPKDMYIEKSSI